MSLELQLADSVPPILVDDGQIEQILVNLILNARDAMPDGGTVRVETFHRGEFVGMRVVDHGVGMEESTRERVFEAFFTTKQRQEGTGLGLYVVYSLVDGMDGEVRIESQLGHGTTVTVEFPSRRDLRVEAKALETELVSVPGGDETVLVVEDRAVVRDLVCSALEEAGYTVLAAATGVEGLGASRSHGGKIDLVLSDVVMPEMSGPEMARRLREERPETRFLFMSGHPERAETLAKELSDVALLMKPILPSELCRRVRATLDAARS